MEARLAMRTSESSLSHTDADCEENAGAKTELTMQTGCSFKHEAHTGPTPGTSRTGVETGMRTRRVVRACQTSPMPPAPSPSTGRNVAPVEERLSKSRVIMSTWPHPFSPTPLERETPQGAAKAAESHRMYRSRVAASKSAALSVCTKAARRNGIASVTALRVEMATSAHWKCACKTTVRASCWAGVKMKVAGSSSLCKLRHKRWKRCSEDTSTGGPAPQRRQCTPSVAGQLPKVATKP